MTRMQGWLFALAPFVSVSLLCAGIRAQDLASPRSIVVEEVRNEQAGFMVRVDVDHENRVYHDGDAISITVRSERAGFLYLIYCQADDNVAVLFPNSFQKDNKIPAHRDIVVPPREGATFRLRIGAPLGKEVLKAIVSRKPLKELEALAIARGVGVDVEFSAVKAAYVEGLQKQPTGWGEHHVHITTVAAEVPAGRRKPRRFAVFIGISNYMDRKINQLSVCHLDAKSMQEVMNSKGGLADSFLLTNEQATLARIEDVIRRRLTMLSAPGDEIFIFWSGHGGRCADENGDEKDGDGMDEFLVPWDGMKNEPNSMLLDDRFGRWIQELDGRRVIIILDTCHSAGQATNAKTTATHGKSVSTSASASKSLGNGPIDFLDSELVRAKDIGQKETAILASSQAAQLSFERREGDLSAMTYFLKDLIDRADRPVTLQQAFDHVSSKVPDYVMQEFPGATQQPVLVNQVSSSVFLRP